jgi:hypothetical protein
MKQLDSTRGGPGMATFSSAVDSRPKHRACGQSCHARSDGVVVGDGIPGMGWPRGGEWCAICGRYRHADQALTVLVSTTPA